MKKGTGSREISPGEKSDIICFNDNGERIENLFTLAHLDVLRWIERELRSIELGPGSKVSIEFKVHNKGLAYTETSDNVYKVTGILTVEIDGEQG